MATPAVLHSSSSMEWETPEWVFDFARERFTFVLDAAARDAGPAEITIKKEQVAFDHLPCNSKVPDNYLTKADDALAIESWAARGLQHPALRMNGDNAQLAVQERFAWKPPAIWLNPPYGRDVGLWVQKAWEQSAHMAVFLLIFSRTETRWWQDYVTKADEHWYFRQRLKFLDHHGEVQAGAPAPSVGVVFTPRMHIQPALVERGPRAIHVP